MSDPPTLPLDPRSLIDIPVRPEADAFPMLDGEAFADLAAGIREHGQIEPIELDTDGAIGDGRNRYAACCWLGIEPRTVTLPAETDWFARVVERNLNRRHATPGARAVALVKAGESQGFSSRALANVSGLSQPTIQRAAFIVAHAPDFVSQVEAGASLRAAYTEAVERERARADSDRVAVDAEARRIVRLEELERERSRLVAAVHKEQEAVGDPVALPPEPALALRIESAPDVEQIIVPTSELDVQALRTQERLHKQLRKLKAEWQAFVSMDSGADKRSGQVYVADATTGAVAVDAYVQLAFDEFREVCVRRATLAAVDIDAIRGMAETWADAHQTAQLDVDAFMDDVKQAAGL